MLGKNVHSAIFRTNQSEWGSLISESSAPLKKKKIALNVAPEQKCWHFTDNDNLFNFQICCIVAH